MKYSIEFLSDAVKQIKKLPKRDLATVKEKKTLLPMTRVLMDTKSSFITQNISAFTPDATVSSTKLRTQSRSQQ